MKPDIAAEIKILNEDKILFSRISGQICILDINKSKHQIFYKIDNHLINYQNMVLSPQLNIFCCKIDWSSLIIMDIFGLNKVTERCTMGIQKEYHLRKSGGMIGDIRHLLADYFILNTTNSLILVNKENYQIIYEDKLNVNKFFDFRLLINLI